jgi:RNA polymerase sigma-70 factor, ECF subfamily
MAGRTLGSTPPSSGGGALTRSAVAEAKAGDSEGIHYLYVRFADEVQRCVASIVRDRGEAAEVTRGVFENLLGTIAGYDEDADEATFDSWLMQVAEDAALEHLRNRRGAPALRQAVGDLPQNQREALVLRHVVGLSPIEIASVLD